MDMSFAHALSNPDALRVILRDGEDALGICQDWLPTAWMRRAGCGPCTAANMLFYLSRKDPSLAGLCPFAPADAKSLTFKQSVYFVREIWKHLTPGRKGVNTAQMFVNGALSYVRQAGMRITAKDKDIPGVTARYEPFAEYADFIQEGLDSDCPVAFLNLSNGAEKNLDGWHWVTVTGMRRAPDDTEVLLEIIDDTKKKTVNFKTWYDSTFLGGALAYFRERL